VLGIPTPAAITIVLLVIGVLQNGVDLLGMSSYWQQAVAGLVLVAAVSIDRFEVIRPVRGRRASGRLEPIRTTR
jgi:ribose/xylose/arabinose/galactoside ABC-type transport system permease subunit